MTLLDEARRWAAARRPGAAKLPKRVALRQRVASDVGIGAIAAIVMDRTTTLVMSKQSEVSLEREKKASPEGVPAAAGRKLASLFGVRPSDETARKAGMAVHGSLGLAGGALVSEAARRSSNTIVAALVASLVLWLVLDEGLAAALGLAPPPADYPLQTHLRGLLGHLAFGLTIGALLEAGSAGLWSGGARRIARLRR
jgi:hypothetical protein